VGAPRKVASESRERTFDVDIAAPDALEGELRRMCAELSASLRSRHRAGRTIGIKVRLDDFSTLTRARTLPAATAELETIERVAIELMRANPPARPVRLLGVRVANLAGSAGPASCGEPEEVATALGGLARAGAAQMALEV
jgi:DNA polymerase-4